MPTLAEIIRESLKLCRETEAVLSDPRTQALMRAKEAKEAKEAKKKPPRGRLR